MARTAVRPTWDAESAIQAELDGQLETGEIDLSTSEMVPPAASGATSDDGDALGDEVTVLAARSHVALRSRPDADVVLRDARRTLLGGERDDGRRRDAVDRALAIAREGRPGAVQDAEVATLAADLTRLTELLTSR